MKKFIHTRQGRSGIIMYNQYDTFIGRSIEMYGEWTHQEMELWEQFLEPGMTVLDIGANIGSNTLGLAKIVGEEGVVHAFEPQRFIYYMLAGNVALNSFKNVYCYMKPVSDLVEDIFIPEINIEEHGNFGALRIGDINEKIKEKIKSLPLNHGIKGETLKSMTIDSLELEHCDFIKIDVEGMEERVLKGAENTIEKFAPYMYVENNQPNKSPSLIRQIDSLGYDMYWHRPAYYNPSNHFGNNQNIFGDAVDPNMLCVHKKYKINIDGAEKVKVG